MKIVMYGIKQADILDYEQLVKHLNTHRYYPVIGTDSIFSHKKRKTKLYLCVYHFGIKHHSRDDADHILNSLKEKYAITTDWGGIYVLRFNLQLELRGGLC